MGTKTIQYERQMQKPEIAPKIAKVLFSPESKLSSFTSKIMGAIAPKNGSKNKEITGIKKGIKEIMAQAAPKITE